LEGYKGRAFYYNGRRVGCFWEITGERIIFNVKLPMYNEQGKRKEVIDILEK
jgi:hypothetical protein